MKEVIGTLIPDEMVKQIARAVISGKYVNRSDFMRQALREKLEREQ